MGKREIKKIVFYTGITRNFRTTLIGYLYEICQVYPVILLSEELDEKLREILENKEIFPKLEKIITANQHTGPKRNIFEKNRYLFNLAKKTIYQHKPDIVIAPYDIYPLEMYLLRFAKRVKATTLTVQEGIAEDVESRKKYVDMINAYLRFPRALPLFARSFLVQCRKSIGHLLYYWILPILVYEKPFFGKSSCVLREGISGMRDSDYRTVFSKREYDIHLKAGVLPEKLYILDHPLKRSTRKFFEEALLDRSNHDEITDKTVTLLLPADEIGFKREECSLVSEKEKMKTNVEIVSLIAKLLKGWKIYIKPHPLVENFDEIRKEFESISDFVKVAKPSEPIDDYIKIGKVIIGLPASFSTALFFASLLFQEKTILSLDFNKELSGDFYKNFKGIEYIDNKDKFGQILELIKENKFKKEIGPEKEKFQAQAREFPGFIDLLDSLRLKET
jgi:hypothetical protein